MQTRKSQTPYSNVQVVLFANRGSAIREFFTESQGLSMVNIANLSCLSHLINQFMQLGFLNLTIVCLKVESELYQEFILQRYPYMVSVFPVDGDKTTCEIIRMLPRAKQNLIFPIDLFTTIDLTAFVDFHLFEKALITIFATQYKLDEKEIQNSPGVQRAVNSQAGQHFFVYDETNPKKLVSLLADDVCVRNDIDLGMKRVERDESLESFSSIDETDEFLHGMEISPEILQNVRSMIVESSSQLTRVYLLSSECVDYLNENEDIHSIESELIPRLCSKLMNTYIYRDGPNDITLRANDCVTLYHINLKCATGKFGLFMPAAQFIPLEGSENGYFAEGKPKVPENFRYTPGSVFGDNFSAGEKTIVTKSVIGRNCKVGKNCVIQNCVIYDHVTIDDGCRIKNCMIGCDSKIPSGSTLTQCFVAPRFSSEKAIKEECTLIKI